MGNNFDQEESDADDKNRNQLIKFDDGNVYALGTRGPCTNFSNQITNRRNSTAGSRPQEFLFGYDVFTLKAVCHDISAPDSPYFNSTEENQQLNYSNKHLANVNRQNNQWMRSSLRQKKKKNGNRRQLGSLTSGLFQVPGSLPQPSLSPCRPGAKRANNFKCTNPHM